MRSFSSRNHRGRRWQPNVPLCLVLRQRPQQLAARSQGLGGLRSMLTHLRRIPADRADAGRVQRLHEPRMPPLDRIPAHLRLAFGVRQPDEFGVAHFAHLHRTLRRYLQQQRVLQTFAERP